MIVQELPRIHQPFSTTRIPVFQDHLLFTEALGESWQFPEHQTGLGLLALLSGSGDCYVNDRKEPLTPDTYLIVSPGSRLSIHLPAGENHPVFLFFHSGKLEQALRDKAGDHPDYRDFSCLERLHPMAPALRQRLDWLVRFGTGCSSFGSLKADSIARALMEELIRTNCSAVRQAEQLPVIKRSTRIELFRRLSLAREWMLHHFASPITLEDMAGIAALNRQHFLRMFRCCFQLTPYQYLIHIRLNAARRMLLETKQSVSHICQQTGFESLSSFSGLFRVYFGAPPSRFRSAGHNEQQ